MGAKRANTDNCLLHGEHVYYDRQVVGAFTLAGTRWILAMKTRMVGRGWTG